MEGDDVARERARVEDTRNADEHAILMRNLRKAYPAQVRLCDCWLKCCIAECHKAQLPP